MKNTATLLISSPDQKGLVASIANFLYQRNGNILHADQHQDNTLNVFLMRVEWDMTDFAIDIAEFERQFAPIAQRFAMTWQVALSSYRSKMAIFVSRHDHCLVDLLYRYKTGELRCDIPLILSNHRDLQWLADSYGIPFVFIPTDDNTKATVEEKQLALLRDHNIDFVVLARYMQILSPEFIRHYPNRIINIHHSFLPAFHGAKPYHRAFARGVKLIGATSHYVTEVLDDGPIIEQDVGRVSHRYTLQDLIQRGADLEKVVLSRAVKWHSENRILLYANKTVIFA